MITATYTFIYVNLKVKIHSLVLYIDHYDTRAPNKAQIREVNQFWY